MHKISNKIMKEEGNSSQDFYHHPILATKCSEKIEYEKRLKIKTPKALNTNKF